MSLLGILGRGFGATVTSDPVVIISDDDTVPERIAQILVARLENIEEANGYHFDIADVKRPSRGKGVNPEHLLAIVKMPDPERNEEIDHPGNPPAIGWTQSYEIQLHCRQSDTEDAVDDDTLINRFAGDAQVAICQPTASWHNWQGLAVNSNLGPPTRMDNSGGKFSGITMRLDVMYRTTEGDPFESR